MTLEIKIKKLQHGSRLPLPTFATPGSSGVDLYAAVEKPVILQPGEISLIHAGIIVEIPPGYEGQVRPRSGLALKHGIGIVNSPGTIDSDYRGEVAIILINFGRHPFTISHGDRIAQMVFHRVEPATIIEVTEVNDTHRGAGGFGHTGLKP